MWGLYIENVCLRTYDDTEFFLMCIIQQDVQNSVIRLYFQLGALHISDYISPSSGAIFISCTSHLVYVDTIRLAVV